MQVHSYKYLRTYIQSIYCTYRTYILAYLQCKWVRKKDFTEVETSMTNVWTATYIHMYVYTHVGTYHTFPGILTNDFTIDRHCLFLHNALCTTSPTLPRGTVKLFTMPYYHFLHPSWYGHNNRIIVNTVL